MDYIFNIQEESPKIFHQKYKFIPIPFNKQRALFSNTYTFIYNLNYNSQKQCLQNNLKNLFYN